ncbi:MAG: prepilin-type N-terminal cleavage/methylation domain-containing protein [Sedimentisphaerales bacterium]
MKNRRAFTLIELLAVIRVLMAILLPVLGRAKESARATAQTQRPPRAI